MCLPLNAQGLAGRRGLGEGVMEPNDIIVLQTAQDGHFPKHPFGLLRASQHIWDALDGYLCSHVPNC